MSKTPEGAVLKAVLDYLAARHVLAFRMNTGTRISEYKGKRSCVRFGVPGMADVLAFVTRGVDRNGAWCEMSQPVWLEVKSAIGKQSDIQRSFQVLVEEEGHIYRVVRSIEDVEAALR